MVRAIALVAAVAVLTVAAAATADVAAEVAAARKLGVSPYLRRKGDPLMVVGHRGAAHSAPENTLVSQLVTVQGGTFWIENDVQPSKDGVIMVMHDSTVDRTTGGKGRIRDHTFAELRQLDAGGKFDPLFSVAGSRIPTLSEQLIDLRQRGGNLAMEIKDVFTKDEIKKLVEIIKAEKMMGRVMALAFDAINLKYLYELAPEIPLCLNIGAVDADPVATAKSLHLSGYHAEYKSLLARPKAVKDLQAIGVHVLAWTPDNPDEWKALDELGVDSICTNRPSELIGWNFAWIQNHRQQPSAAVVDVAPSVAVPSGLSVSPYMRKKGQPLLNIGHRGAARSAPENTLISQLVAIKGGALWIENDVQPSKDGVPVVMHDDKVDRTTNGRGLIRNLTVAQLKTLDAGMKFSPLYAGTHIPTFAEQLAALRTLGGYLAMEIKGLHSKAEVERLVTVIKAENMMDRVLGMSFDQQNLKYLYEVEPKIPLAYITGSMDADPVALAKSLHLAGYHISSKPLLEKPSIVKDLQAAGVHVLGWTPDDPEIWKQLDDIGVDSICTNRPAELAGWLWAWVQNHKS